MLCGLRCMDSLLECKLSVDSPSKWSLGGLSGYCLEEPFGYCLEEPFGYCLASALRYYMTGTFGYCLAVWLVLLDAGFDSNVLTSHFGRCLRIQALAQMC